MFEKACDIIDWIARNEWTLKIIIFIATLCVGWFLAYIVRKLSKSLINHKRVPVSVAGIISKILVGLIWGLAVLQALHSVGVNVASILGAAGVAGIAIGFASQTALSNVISGIFIVSERSIKPGDYIRVNGEEGTVQSINLLSVTLRQVNNALVRIPCEMMIKNPIVNVTTNPIRRCDMEVGVDYSSNLEHVREVIRDVIHKQPLLENDPEPVIQFASFGESSVNLCIGAWCKTPVFYQARYQLAHDLLEAFRKNNINIPFPTRALLMQQCEQAQK